MGYLNGNTITVDAILTKHGRQKLAEGQSLGITKFAPKYLFFTREFLKIYIGLLLITLCNPIIKINDYKDILDNKILFNIGLLLILSSVFYSSIEYNMRELLKL